jgi:CheY-like chemotaxis protein
VELMGGETHVESTYGEGSGLSFHIIQKLETFRPMTKFSLNDNIRVAVLQTDLSRTRILANKIRKLGVLCDIIDNLTHIDQYTHIFFNYTQFDMVLKVHCPHTKFFAVAHGLEDNEKVTPNMEIIYMPLTSLLLARLLGDNTNNQNEINMDKEKYSLRLHDTQILVVDDIEINLIIAEETLLHYGGRIDTADSGIKALEMIKENDYDLVFMDHMMPEMDGVDVTQIIRSWTEAKYQELPIVALTANVVGDVRDMFMKSGMSDFLSKPMESAEMERVLRQWLPPEKWESTIAP